MQRTLTAIVTALWLAPLLGWRIGVVLAASVSHSSGTPQITAAERGMGEGLVMLGGGILAGMAIFVATIALILAYFPTGSLRWLQVADGIAIACLFTWWLSEQAKIRQHDQPTYDGFTATLDIEVRAPKSLVGPSTRFFANMLGGYSDDHDLIDLTREEGDYSIVPIELRIISVHDWVVQVMRDVKPNVVGVYKFELGWRDYPKSNLTWSDWIEPIQVAGREATDSDEVTIRYRWVLTPIGQTRVYQP
jgi:hypothetical protein